MASVAAGTPTLARRLLVALAVPLIGYALYATGQQAMEAQRMAKQAADLNRAVLVLQADNVRLQNDLNYRRGDEYAERVAREQLGLAMPGDTTVTVVGAGIRPDHELQRTADTVAETRAPATPLDAWREHFFGS
jgi:cell division protein FtsB